jgi:hypothetical protein
VASHHCHLLMLHHASITARDEVVATRAVAGALAAMVAVLPPVDRVAATTTLVDLLARSLVRLGDGNVLSAKCVARLVTLALSAGIATARTMLLTVAWQLWHPHPVLIQIGITTVVLHIASPVNWIS